MNPKAIISWAILVLAVALAFTMVYGAVRPQVRLVSSAELMEAGLTADGDQAFYHMREGGLSQVVAMLGPVLLAAVGFILKDKVKKGG